MAWQGRQHKQGGNMKLTEDAVQELNALAGRSGKLTPEQVLEAAENESSALHGCFTWDDGEAAAKWRIEEARELIRSVRIEVIINERTIRSVAYVRDPAKETNQAGYIDAMKVRKQSPDVIRNELTAIIALVARAIGIAEVQNRGDVAGMLATVSDKLESIEDII
jgi:hypothetical protein